MSHRIPAFLALILILALTACNQAAAPTAAPTSSASNASFAATVAAGMLAKPTGTAGPTTIGPVPTAAPTTAAKPAATVAPTAPAKNAPAATPAAPVKGSGTSALTVADVEKVSGLTGIKQVAAGQPLPSGAQVAFTRADGSLLVWAAFSHPLGFSGVRSATRMNTTSVDVYTEVPGIGDAAFETGPKATTPNFLAAMRGKAEVYLWLDKANPGLNQQQLRDLAKLAIARLSGPTG